MLTQQQITEIREHLEKAQNPLFFFDNDVDGLVSYLLFKRFLDRGKAVAVKGSHSLDTPYYRKINELKPDYIFILDIPLASKEFLEKLEQENLPTVWIDHHNVEKPESNHINYYNPYHNDKTNEPVSYLNYKITNQKQDLWLAVAGCVSDYYLPEFYKEFEEKYPELTKKNPKNPFDVLFNSQIGKIARILDFSLKDTTTNVLKMLRFMSKIKSPQDILEETPETRQLFKRYNEINPKYQDIIKRARKLSKEKIIFFTYSGDISLSSNLANQLSYEFPKKIIIVAYVSKGMANLSIRGNFVDVRTMTLKTIEKLEGARGGGHEHATGAKIREEDLDKFKQSFLDLLE